MIPIWKDTYLTIDGELSPLSYNISYTEGEEEYNVFNGKAWIKPTAEEIKIKINEVCSNYLHPQNIDLSSVGDSSLIEHIDAVKTFVITNIDTNEVIDNLTFYYDWSYKPTEFNQPINKIGANGMFYFNTYQLNNDNKIFTSITKTKPEGYIDGCGEWALYYVNRCGGWDGLLIEGNVIKKDSYTRFQKENVIDNNHINEFEQQTFQTNISTSYTLHTGWFSDKQSEVLATNIFSTQLAYLHNLKTDEIVPVNINDAEAEYKTFKGNGNKLIKYTINVISAQRQKIKG